VRRADVGRLVALSAIWGASFLFMRIAAPALGPAATADLRMLIAGVALTAWFAHRGFDPQWRRWAGQYFLVGAFNSAAPFLLYSYAALELSAGAMAVINAISPMFAALLSVVFLRERLMARRVAGLALGIAGVALISRPSGGGGLALAAALGAAFSYALSAVYLRRWARDVPARGMAVGTQLAGAVLLLPLTAAYPPAAASSALVWANVLALGLLCSALAYLLYFRLIADIGATQALSVTYLIPIFGLLWGALFLGEPVSLAVLAGALLVIAGTALVLRG
jgi:drug/metabolite transporter (DMT)-like permease